MIELTKRFYFESAHTLIRVIDAEPSRRIHGHTYHAEVTLRGEPDPQSGMLLDLGILERVLAEVRDQLDHHFLDEIADLGPATMENLAMWIWRKVQPKVPNLARVCVYREASGDTCCYAG